MIGAKKCTESFNKIKNLLTTTSTLKIVDPFKYFFVCTDTCNEGLGGVLIHENYVVSYKFGNVKEHENNYVTHDIQLGAIIYAVKMWQHYLIRRRFLLMSNNITLKYLFDHDNIQMLDKLGGCLF